ncbi:hypothetical protein Glove_494g11 [Diversispora epigaea]|uniref:DUF1640 domain-containing protein n=1 Tax=Diversispora epigaea TaxID=1348612 RepID=A0A397GI58_9GLOM|nr:hypothetical protein Glove_494g11 [Diversispora epigaea]
MHSSTTVVPRFISKFTGPNKLFRVTSGPNINFNRSTRPKICFLSNTSTSNNAQQNNPLALPPPPATPASTTPLPPQQPMQQKVPTRHYFNTYKVVKDLEGYGFSRGQAEAIMRVLEALLNNSSRIRSFMLSKADLENETYLYKAALEDFRTEIQINRKKNLSDISSETAEIQREVSALKQKFQENIATMNNGIQLDINNRKAEVREEQKKMELSIQELNNKFTIASGDIRTEIEAMKWETTRMALMGIFGSAVFILFVMFLISNKKSKGKNGNTTTPGISEISEISAISTSP